MKSNLIVILCLGGGIACGILFGEHIGGLVREIPNLLLYLLILQVGLNIGANGELKALMRNIGFTTLMLPLFTIIGTLVMSAAAALLLRRWDAAECMAVGSGFGYYSLSSLLITQLKEASDGIETASQLGAVALLSNIIREITALVGAPLFVALFGKFAAVAAAGSTSMDVCLPIISRHSGKSIVPIALLHGIVLDMSVPLLISVLCG